MTEQLSGAFMAVPPLISNCLILPIGTQRRSWRVGSCLPEIGDKKASMPESATGPFSASISAYILLVKINNMVKPDAKETRKYNPPPREAQQTFGNKDVV